jgi:type II secretory pathway pseudopilin PulG
MYLAGQGARGQPTPPVQKLDDGGYIMVVLLIGIAVSAVWMGALLPAWRQQTVRQKEAELIFRGEEYARAIALYWRKNNQTLPPSFDVLVSQRYLRKKYLDPMTNREFLAVGGVGPGSTSPSPLPSPSPSAGGRALGPGAAPGGQNPFGARAGISGVRSTSTATSIVVYRGQTSYSQFPFDYIVALQRMGAGTPQLGGDPSGGRGGVRRGGIGTPARPGDEVSPAFPGAVRSGQPGPGRGISEGRGLPVAPGRGR